MSAVLTVSQINTYLKSIFEYDENLRNIYVSGEISNFTNHYRTGHFYFTLKDEKAALKAVMFRSAASRIRFTPENGMKVIIRGNISVFERDGVYQLYAEDMMPDGIGALNLAFEQLKRKLAALGMFSDEHKKPLPQFPQKIGVITSPSGAAVHDIMTVLERRYPCAEIVFEPVAVQGDSVAPQIAAAIEKFNRLNGADVLIVGRGGGSIEDLWAFNEEEVAYAIFNSDIPIISAVGHETDFTIADFVSDMRAPTPSAAAEIAVPNYLDLLYTIDKMFDSITNSMLSLVSSYQLRISNSEKILAAHMPSNLISSYDDATAYLSERMTAALNSVFSKYSSSLSAYAMKLDALNPLRILSKGYCAVENSNKQTVTCAEKLNVGDEVDLIFADGRAKCKVEETVFRKRGNKQ